MKKPELKDYGLTEEIIAKHRSEVNKYEHKKQVLEKENSRYNIQLIAIISILVVLALVIYVQILSQTQEFTLYFVITMILNTVVLYILLGKEESTIKSILLYFVLSMCLPIISIGGAIYILKKRDEEYITKFYPPQKYYSISIEKSIENYRKAVQKYNRWKEQCRIDYWINMDGYEFEDAIANLYSEQGYIARQTSYSADGGVDIILTKDGEKTAVQCKHHAKPVGPHDVRALIGVVASQEYDSGIFVSLNGFTSTVYDEVRTSKIPVQLISLAEILSMIHDVPEKKCANKKTEKQFHVVKNQTIYHKVFNQGYVKEILDNVIVIQFDEVKKKFIIPDAFEQGFLSVTPFSPTQTKPSQAKPQNNLSTAQNHPEMGTKKVCVGNCSTCKREHCIEEK